MLLSYDYQNEVRDLSPVVQVVQKQQPSLIRLISFVDPSSNEAASSTKHEWGEDSLGPMADQVNGAKLATDNTLNPDNIGKFQVGQVIQIDESDELIFVSNVDKATSTLTIQRGYAGSTAEAIEDNALIRIISKPLLQGTPKGDNPSQQPGTAFNYTQIFDGNASISRTALNTGNMLIEDKLDYAVKVQMDQIMRQMNTTFYFGRPVQPQDGVPGMAGGIRYFLKQPGGNAIDAAGAAVSDTLLNNALEEIFLDGGNPAWLAMATNQARRISGFNSDKIRVVQEDQRTGRAVYEFVGDLPLQGRVQGILVEPNMPKTEIAILDPSKLRAVPLKNSGFKDMDATDKGFDGVARRIVGEYTLEVKNAKDGHGIIHGLQK